jgi:DNA ligase-associated metallophosphoesterase
MNGHGFTLAGVALVALGSGALWWPELRLLAVSDLHLGKSARLARVGGAMLPPYETRDTLARLEADIRRTDPAAVACLGDSFDDLAAAADLGEDERLWLTRLQAGRRWIWVAGNHDPGPVDLGGMHLAEMLAPPLAFRHVARRGASGEVSGHFHPKAVVRTRGGAVVRPCFLIDGDRVILPAFGTFTGGLRTEAPALSGMMRPGALAVLTGPAIQVVPMPR